MENPLISIIVPVYNAELFLNKCIESIINQTYSDIEIILVDDGSKDNSGAICDGFSAKDSRVKTFHQSNGGPAKARNFGLDNAAGDFITFVDSDDYIEPDYIEKLFKAFDEKTNVVVCMHKQKNNVNGKEKTVCLTAEDKVVSIDENFNFCEMWINYLSACKLYRKSVIGETRFDESIFSGEDALFFATICKKISAVKYISYCGYHYVIHGDTLSGGKFNEKRMTIVKAWNQIISLFSDFPLSYRAAKGQLLSYMAKLYTNTVIEFGLNNQISEQIYKTFFSKNGIKNYAGYIAYHKSKYAIVIIAHFRWTYDHLVMLYKIFAEKSFQ